MARLAWVGLLAWLLAAPAGAQTIQNPSFETSDYTGWTLFESDIGFPAPAFGTWGIASDGQTILPGDAVFDYFDGIFVNQSSPGLPHTYTATDGTYVALQLQLGGQTHSMSQSVQLCPTADQLTWDMEFDNHNFSGFVAGQQQLEIRMGGLTLFSTNTPGTPLAIPMTPFAADISALAGQVVTLEVEMIVNQFFFDAAFDNFVVEGCDGGPPPNLPPTCDSGGPYEIACGEGPLSVQLDGGASADPEGQPLSYDWQVTCGADASLDDAASESPTLTVESPLCAATSCTVGLTVSDGLHQTGCAAQTVPVLGKQSVEDLVFDASVTSVQVPPDSTQVVTVQLQNTGSCPNAVMSADVIDSLTQAPHVQVVGLAPTASSCPQGYQLQLGIDTTDIPGGTYQRRVKLVGVDGSSVAATIEIVVGALSPDLTPISTSSPSIVVTGDYGAPPLDAGEGATIAVQVRNVGAAVAGPYEVNFFSDGALLGTDAGAAGLAPGTSALAQLSVPGGTLAEGTHVLSVEVATPQDAESNLANNSASGFLEVGTPAPGEDALIEVVAGVSGACEDGLIQVSGYANYRFFPSGVDYPVKGGPATITIYPDGGATPILSASLGHTNTNGNFGLTLDAPGVGAYTAVVEVTDLTLTGEDASSFVIEPAASCTPPPPPPPPPAQPTLGFATCEKNATGDPIAFGDPVFTIDSQLCAASGLVKGRDLTVRGTGTYSPAVLELTGELFSDDGAGDFSSVVYENAALDPISVPFEQAVANPDDQSCIPAPEADAVFRLSLADESGLDPPRQMQPVTQVRLGSLTTGNVSLEVENLHTERACRTDFGVFGRVRYTTGSTEYGSGVPLSCGTARAFLLDPSDGTTVLATSGVSRTAPSGAVGVGGFGYQLPPNGVEYPVRLEVSDGVLTHFEMTTARCVQSVGGCSRKGGCGGSSPAPPPDVSVQDLFVYAEDVAFLGDGTCSVGLSGTPEPGDTIGIAATIHLDGDDDPITNQPITVLEHLPVNGVLQESVVAQPTVDFPTGSRLANVCVSWTPQTRGSRVIEVDIDPDVIAQYQLNDAATRAISIGRNLCSLELSGNTVTLGRGDSASLFLNNLHDESITPVLDLTLQTLSGAPLPVGLTGSFTPATIAGDQVSELVLSSTAATPPGRYSLVAVADGISCTAVAAITVEVLGQSPELDPIADQSLQCGTRSVPLSAIDPDGDSLTLLGAGLPAFATLVDGGDGSGSIEISASAADRGTYPDLSVKAEDPYGFFDRESFQIEVTDQVPVVTPIDDRSLSCLGGTIGVSASDADGDALSLGLVSSTPYASLVDAGDGSGTITIGTGILAGTHTIEVTATDQTCGETLGESFTLTVPANLPPLFTAIPPLEMTAGETLSVPLEAYDPEGGLVTFGATDLTPFGALETVTLDTSAVFMPGDEHVGEWVVELIATDPCGGLSTMSFVLTVIPANQPPVADAGGDRSVNEGSPMVALDGTASSDVDGDPLSYSWTQIAGEPVALDDPTAAQPSFAAPYVSANETLTFKLVVHDGTVPSEPATVNVTIVNSNYPPVPDAGDDGTIKELAVATLDATNSYDPEGETDLEFDWVQISGPPVTLSDPTSPTPSFTAPLGVDAQLLFEVVVGDGQEWSGPDEVTYRVVENSAPVANAGPDQTRGEFTQVTLDGTGSSDPDGDPLSYQWVQISGPPVALDDPTSPTPSFVAPLVASGGDAIVFQLVVTDDDQVKAKSSAPDLVTVNVTNVNDPPRCDLGRSICPDTKFKSKQGVDECVLWPPNHAMLEVGIAGVTDDDSAASDVTLRITGVTQDEPIDGLGDGDTSPDAAIQSGEQTDSVLLRSERSGLGDGRVYVVDFTADDGLESCTGSVTISVPHDRKDTAIDSGQDYDSTGS